MPALLGRHGGREWLDRRARLARGAGAGRADRSGSLFDWITTGSPTYSFTGTRETVETLDRQTGPVDLVLYGPRAPRRSPAVAGDGRRRSAASSSASPSCAGAPTLGIVAAVLALGAFALLACAGLAIIARYTMLGGGDPRDLRRRSRLLGWRLLERRPPLAPRAGRPSPALVALMFVVWAPNQ